MAHTAPAYRKSPGSASENLSPHELWELVEYSGLSDGTKTYIRASLKISGRAGVVIFASNKSLGIEMRKSKRTVQYHRRRILHVLKIGRIGRKRDTWDACPKCGSARDVNTCDKCGYRCDHTGHKEKLPNGEWRVKCPQFRRTNTVELDADKIRSFQPRSCERRGEPWRNYKQYSDAMAKKPQHRSTSHDASGEGEQQEVPAAKPVLVAAAAAVEQQPIANIPPRGHAFPTQISSRLATSAKRLMEFCGLPHLCGNERYIEAAILAEAKFRGVELEEAAKHLADRVLRDQRSGITVGRFYFRDAKWRSSHAGSKPSASQQRSERSKRNILDGFAANARGPDAPDGPEREE